MTPRARLALFLFAAAVVLPAIARVALAMPAFGDHPLPYGDVINRIGAAQRHVTNMVTAVNFDIRAIDTLGEEFILLCAVTGVSVLLRGARGEQTSARAAQVHGRPLPPPSDPVVLACRLFGVPILIFGLYVALHATATPGGGFQGGAIIASGTLLSLLGEGYQGWRKLMPSEALDAAEGAGALLFALCGFAPMLAGAPFLANLLPLGQTGDVFSGGLMLVINAGVTLAVAGGFGVLFLEFLEETRIQPAAGDDA